MCSVPGLFMLGTRGCSITLPVHLYRRAFSDDRRGRLRTFRMITVLNINTILWYGLTCLIIIIDFDSSRFRIHHNLLTHIKLHTLTLSTNLIEIQFHKTFIWLVLCDAFCFNQLGKSDISNCTCITTFNTNTITTLTLVLLNPDRSCLCKQCRSRSVGFWRSQLIWSTLFVIKYVNLYQQSGSSNLTGWKWSFLKVKHILTSNT